MEEEKIEEYMPKDFEVGYRNERGYIIEYSVLDKKGLFIREMHMRHPRLNSDIYIKYLDKTLTIKIERSGRNITVQRTFLFDEPIPMGILGGKELEASIDKCGIKDTIETTILLLEHWITEETFAMLTGDKVSKKWKRK